MLAVAPMFPFVKIMSVSARFFERQPKFWFWIEMVLLLLCIGYIDYATGYEISIVLFYSLPILLTLWFRDRTSAVLMALLAAIVWWWADEAAGHTYSQGWHQIWETAVRLVYFLLFVFGGASVKSRIALLERSRGLEQEILRISEREQQRIGRDLHDGICQYFAAVGCAAGSLKRSLEKQGARQVVQAAEIESLILGGVGQTRSIARGLLPVENDEAGLQAALQCLADSATQLLGLKCSFDCEKPVPVFDNVCATHLYRIAQESISNASRHGKANAALIRLRCDHSRVSLTVSDDGVGIQPIDLRGKGLGLGIMQYRARMINGDFEVAAKAGGGTMVHCSFDQQT